MIRVIELILILTLCVSGLLIGGFQGRFGKSAGRHAPEEMRLLGAVRRACSAFLLKETQILVPAAVVLAVLLTGFVLVRNESEGIVMLVSPAAGVVLGATVSALLAHFSLQQAASVTLRGLEAQQMRRSAGEVLTRGSSWTAIATDAVGLLLVLGWFSLHYAHARLSCDLEAGAASWQAALSLPALALGTVCSGAIFQVGGNNFQTATTVACAAARDRQPALATKPQLNPALVAEIAGGFVGTAVSRTTDAISSALVGSIALVLLSASMVRQADSAANTLSYVALPLLLRTIGMFAASVVSFSFNWAQPHLIGVPQVKGALSVVSGAGLIGALLWLIGVDGTPWLTASGALGLVAGLGTSSSTTDDHNYQGLAYPSDPLNAETARAMGVGLQRSARPLVVVACCLVGAWLLGGLLEVEEGRSLGLIVALAMMLSCNAFHHGTSLLKPLAEAMSLIVSVLRSESEGFVVGSQLSQACDSASHDGRTQSILSGAACCLVIGLAIPSLASQQLPSGGHPALLFAGFLGAAFLLFHIGGVLRLSSRTAVRVGSDLLTHLRQDIGTENIRLNPSAPRGYRASVELASEAATDALLPAVLLATATPLALAIVLHALEGPEYGSLAARALMMFATVATLTGCLAALASHGALNDLRAKFSQPHGSLADRTASQDHFSHEGPSGFSVAPPSLPSAAHFLGHSVSPAALLGLEATMVASLVLLPFLI